MLDTHVARITWVCCSVMLTLGWNAAKAEPASQKDVTVTGKAVGLSLGAQEEARADALRQAVQQACGAFINAQTQVENYQATYDHVMSLAAGFIESYSVEREWQDAELSYCTIRATVSTSLVEKEWAAFAHTYKRAGYPRVVVVIAEDDDIDDARPPITGGSVQSIVENFFLSKGVTLMDKQQTDSVRERDLSLAAINDDVNRLASVAAAFNAEVVVYGQASAKYAGTVDVGGRQTHRWDISLTVRTIQTDSARVLSSNVYRPERRYTSTSRGSGGDALLNLAREEAPNVLRDLGTAWNANVVNYTTCQLSFTPCSRKRFKTIRDALAEVRGVQAGSDGIRLRELVNEVASVEVDWQFELSMLADRIEELDIEGMTVEITEQTGNRLTIRVNAAE